MHHMAMVGILVVVLSACNSVASPNTSISSQVPTLSSEAHPTATPNLATFAAQIAATIVKSRESAPSSEPSAPPVKPQTDQVAVQLLEQAERIASLEQQLATVEAQNSELLAFKQPGLPTSPQYSPTPEDFKALAFDRVEAAYAGRMYLFSFSDWYSPHASVYIATACVTGSDTSFGGFREFLDQTLLMVRRTNSQPVLSVFGEEAISQIIRIADGIPNLGPSSEMSECTRRYLYPTSFSDATPAIELVKSFENLDRISPDSRDSYLAIRDQRQFKLFGAWLNQSRPLLPWLCDQIKPDLYVSCRWEAEVITPFRDFRAEP